MYAPTFLATPSMMPFFPQGTHTPTPFRSSRTSVPFNRTYHTLCGRVPKRGCSSCSLPIYRNLLDCRVVCRSALACRSPLSRPGPDRPAYRLQKSVRATNCWRFGDHHPLSGALRVLSDLLRPLTLPCSFRIISPSNMPMNRKLIYSHFPMITGDDGDQEYVQGKGKNEFLFEHGSKYDQFGYARSRPAY